MFNVRRFVFALDFHPLGVIYQICAVGYLRFLSCASSLALYTNNYTMITRNIYREIRATLTNPTVIHVY